MHVGKAGLGAGSATVSGLAPDQRYYVRLYAENASGFDWTGKEFSPRTQPGPEHLPFGLAMWFDGEDVKWRQKQSARWFFHYALVG